MGTRLQPEERRSQILDAAVLICIADGYNSVNQYSVAEKLGVSHTLIYYHFKTTKALKNLTIKSIVSRLKMGFGAEKELRAVADALSSGCKAALNAPTDIKRRAVETLL